MSFSIYVLQVVAFVDLLAVGLIVPLVSGHVRNLGGSHLYVGLLGSIYAGFQLVSGPIIGSLSDLKGRKSIMILTQLICAVAYTVLGLTNSILIILLMRAVLGLFKQTQMLSKALVPDYEKDEKKQGDIYGKMAAISGVGITLGPIIGGHIAEDNPENGFLLIAIVVGIFFAINSSIVYFLPNCDNKKQSKSNSKAKVVPKSILQSAYGSIRQSIVELYYIEWSIYWDIFFFKALIGFAMGVYYSNYSLYLKSVYDLSPKYIGYVIAFQGVIGSICSFFIGFINNFYIHDKDYSIRNFHVFLVISISLFGLLMSFNVYIYTLWLIPLAVSNAVGRLVTLEMVLKRSHGDHRGTLIGASNSMRSLTGVVSPMVSGFIGEYYGVSYVIYASLLSTLLGVVLSYRNKIKLKAD
ncbi:major facilitator superfamily domain-containing protein 9-like [Trichoplusia ni]|uniref:Major facilitator superfamily domain-containing protein 9-like n=1 Tax=Trichoplusia ni TaxID=7111 RepID=A0A7E5W9X4_TRINI|nr:major facilitator superfamily domain-containing protein 9-like [Trichoplusia ni]